MNNENLTPYRKGEARARENGRKGGIASGIKRKRDAEILKHFRAYMEFSSFIDSLSDAEYQDFISDFTEAEQEYIRYNFRPTKEDTKQQNRLFKKYFR